MVLETYIKLSYIEYIFQWREIISFDPLTLYYMYMWKCNELDAEICEGSGGGQTYKNASVAILNASILNVITGRQKAVGYMIWKL